MKLQTIHDGRILATVGRTIYLEGGDGRRRSAVSGPAGVWDSH